MNHLKILALPIALGLAACATQPPGGGSPTGGSPVTAQCDDGNTKNVIPCVITVDLSGDTPVFTPRELHVHYGPTYIKWILKGERLQFRIAQRDGIYFKRSDPDGGPFENGGIIDPDSRLNTLVPTLRIARAFQWYDVNPPLPSDKPYVIWDYGVQFRDDNGREFKADPPVVNHGSH